MNLLEIAQAVQEGKTVQRSPCCSERPWEDCGPEWWKNSLRLVCAYNYRLKPEPPPTDEIGSKLTPNASGRLSEKPKSPPESPKEPPPKEIQTDYWVNVYSHGRLGAPRESQKDADACANRGRIGRVRLHVAEVELLPKDPTPEPSEPLKAPTATEEELCEFHAQALSALQECRVATDTDSPLTNEARVELLRYARGRLGRVRVLLDQIILATEVE